MMKITVPADIQIKNFATGNVDATVPFGVFVRMTLLSDSRFAANYKSLSTAQRIDQALDAGAASGAVVLQTGDWDLLKSVAEAPSAGYQGLVPMAMIQLVPFIDAIVGASRIE